MDQLKSSSHNPLHSSFKISKQPITVHNKFMNQRLIPIWTIFKAQGTTKWRSRSKCKNLTKTITASHFQRCLRKSKNKQIFKTITTSRVKKILDSIIVNLHSMTIYLHKFCLRLLDRIKGRRLPWAKQILIKLVSVIKLIIMKVLYIRRWMVWIQAKNLHMRANKKVKLVRVVL